MCIICTDIDLGEQYLNQIASARKSLKRCEKILLELHKIKPEANYGKAQKMLVRIRKSIGKVEETRELKS